MFYTYLIGWSGLRKYYYGVRYSKTADPKDLWVSYFTSSKAVNNFRKAHGEPDIIQIRKTFSDKDDARLWEHKVLRRMKVVKNDFWLNKTDNISISSDCNHSWTEKSRKKASDSHKGLKFSEQHKLNLSKALKGRKTPWLTGIPRPDHAIKMSGSGNSRAITVEFDGKRYGTIKDFMEDQSVSYYMAKKMINNNQMQQI